VTASPQAPICRSRVATLNYWLAAGARVVAVSVGNQAAGTQILLKDKNGNAVLEHTPELSFAVVILSSPELVKGGTYTITVGAQSGEFEAS